MAGKKEPKASTKGISGVREKDTVASLEKNAKQASSELSSVRKQIAANEAKINTKVEERKKIEAKIRSVLRKNIASERKMLSVLEDASSKKQLSLKKKIVSLEKINQVYSEKEARINEAKKKQAALKKQLDILESQVAL